MFPDVPILEPGKDYSTPSLRRWHIAQLVPRTMAFYACVFNTMARSGLMAVAGKYDRRMFAAASVNFHRGFERIGGRIEIEGAAHLLNLDRPVIFAGNHMSSFETFYLPSVLLPYTDFTFVIKRSLMKIPMLAAVLRARTPIMVSRKNAREDLVAVLQEGCKRLESGKSVVVFPQATRSATFDPGSFNTLATKLARRSGAPIVPLALKTDCWKLGRLIKDLGGVDVSRTARFAFGAPITVEGNGSETQSLLLAFVLDHLRRWGVPIVGEGGVVAEASAKGVAESDHGAEAANDSRKSPARAPASSSESAEASR